MFELHVVSVELHKYSAFCAATTTWRPAKAIAPGEGMTACVPLDEVLSQLVSEPSNCRLHCPNQDREGSLT